MIRRTHEVRRRSPFGEQREISKVIFLSRQNYRISATLTGLKIKMLVLATSDGQERIPRYAHAEFELNNTVVACLSLRLLMATIAQCFLLC